jgi:hypothetical protein
MSKEKPICAVDGVIVVHGYPRKPILGVCAHSGVTVNGITHCLAHGNKRCRHKITKK